MIDVIQSKWPKVQKHWDQPFWRHRGVRFRRPIDVVKAATLSTAAKRDNPRSIGIGLLRDRLEAGRHGREH
ncbi:hypothetical protein ABFT80_23120 [Mesorhizobium sp. SB112]|uniref:hypothetical protein n=1 Tax=Mesorhizobium sp. SB112 TaxID=3151853 RepID=UPI003267E988